ncbi:MAG: diguanylate cyclase [Pseudolabrys sp.]
MLFAQGALFLLRTPMVALLPGSPGDSLFGSVWMTVLSSEALLLTISDAFILLAMAKERTELHHRTAAMVDPVTGIANRRSFLQNVVLAAKRHIGNPRPAAVLLIDLDHFKSINDRFGHAIGDRVLRMFAEAARKSMRGSDLIGRGDEFASMLLETTREKASRWLNGFGQPSRRQQRMRTVFRSVRRGRRQGRQRGRHRHEKR